MIMREYRSARVNVRLLVILVWVVVVLGVGAVVGRQVRRNILANRALAAGKAALEKKDWRAASKHLREYLSRCPTDGEMLQKCAEANLKVRPLEPGNVGVAIDAYRRLLRLDPQKDFVYEQLAKLYTSIGNFEELDYIARQRLERIPDDPQATVWLARALLAKRNAKEARQRLSDLIKQLDEKTEKCPEYVEACVMLGEIAAQGETDEAKTEALKWLDRAVEYDPKSPEALVNRARFYRVIPALPGQNRGSMLAAARADLEAADALEPSDLRIRLVLSEEWMAFGQLDRAAGEIQAVANVDDETITEYFLDPNDWVAAKFIQAGKLAILKGTINDAVAMADKVLSSLTQKRHRFLILPLAVELYVRYVSGNRAEKVRTEVLEKALKKTLEKARNCLNEYIELRRLIDPSGAIGEDTALLQAQLARAEDKPYRVIENAEPLVTREARDRRTVAALRLLAEAYSRTDQTRRAIRALVRYLRIVPKDQYMRTQLAREYIKQREWNKALETARISEASGSTDVVIKLLRIEAAVHADEGPTAVTPEARNKTLSKLWNELADLQELYPNRVDIRILQAVVADNQGRGELVEKILKSAIKQCKDTLRAELQLARFYFREKRMGEAVQACQAACRRHPQTADPWLTLAQFHITQRQFDQVRQTIKEGLKVITGRWEKRNLLLQSAMVDLLYGQRQAGIDKLKAAAEKYQDDVRTRSLLLNLPEIRQDVAAAGKLVDEIHQIQGATGLLWRLHQARLWLDDRQRWRAKQRDITKMLEHCIDADPEWSDPVLLLGAMYVRLGDLERAEAIYRRILSLNPAAAQVADRLVTLLESQRRFTEAEEILGQIDASDRALSAHRIRAGIWGGNLAQAIDELKLRVAADANDVNSRILLARLLYEQTKDVEAAMRYLDEAEAVAPEPLGITTARVSILRAEKRLDEARKLLDAEVERNNSFAAYVLRAAFFASIGENELAEKDYTHLASLPHKAGYELLGKFYADSNRMDDAITAWEEGSKHHPKNLSMKRRLLQALIMRGKGNDRERAVELLDELKGQLPYDPVVLWLRAHFKLEESKKKRDEKEKEIARKEAQKLLEEAVELAPKAVDPQLRLISLAMEDKDYTKARDLAVRALAMNPKNPRLLLARAEAEQALNNLPMARELAHMVLNDDPDNVNAREFLIREALNSRDKKALKDVQQLVNEAIAKDPQNERLQLATALLLDAAGRRGEAVDGLESYCRTEAGKKNVPALLALAELYRVGGDIVKSEKLIDRAEELAPDSPLVVRQRVIWLGAQKKFDNIVTLMAAYRKKQDADALAINTAASVLATSQSAAHKREAMVLFEHLIAAAPEHVEPKLGLALLAYQMGNVERSEKIYRKVLESDPNNVQALNDLAWVLAEARQDYKAALKLAEKGLWIDPENLHLLDTRGVILSNLPGRLADARVDFRKAVELSPPDSPRRAKELLQLARVCAQLKDFVHAKQHADQALRIDGNHRVFTPKERTELDKITASVPARK